MRPQPPQKRLPGSGGNPQAGHTTSSAAPQPAQTRRPEAFSRRHCGQITGGFGRPRLLDGAYFSLTQNPAPRFAVMAQSLSEWFQGVNPG